MRSAARKGTIMRQKKPFSKPEIRRVRLQGGEATLSGCKKLGGWVSGVQTHPETPYLCAACVTISDS